MGRLDSERTIGNLVALTRSDIPRQVDALVDAYLVGTDPGQFWQTRAELALEFLNAAPLSELSYRIWRRITGEADDGEGPYQSPSMQFLPPVEFQISR
jgi:hypothetical protein